MRLVRLGRPGSRRGPHGGPFDSPPPQRAKRSRGRTATSCFSSSAIVDAVPPHYDFAAVRRYVRQSAFKAVSVPTRGRLFSCPALALFRRAPLRPAPALATIRVLRGKPCAPAWKRWSAPQHCWPPHFFSGLGLGQPRNLPVELAIRRVPLRGRYRPHTIRRYADAQGICVREGGGDCPPTGWPPLFTSGARAKKRCEGDRRGRPPPRVQRR